MKFIYCILYFQNFYFGVISVRSGYKFGFCHKFIVFPEKFRNPWDASPKKSQAFQLCQARPLNRNPCESLGQKSLGLESLGQKCLGLEVPSHAEYIKMELSGA